MSGAAFSTPYIVGNPVFNADFYDREALIADLLDERRRIVYLVGRRRSGKTSILKRLEQLAPAVVIYLDVSTTSGSWKSLAKGLANQIKRRAQAMPRLSTVCESNDATADELLNRLTEQAEKTCFQVLLLLDEADRLSELKPKDLKKLRACLQAGAMDNARPALRTILAAGKQLGSLNSREEAISASFLDGVHVLYVPRFTDEAARRLVRQDQHPAGPIAVEETTEAQILSLAGNQPYLMQQLCYDLFDPYLRHLRAVRPVHRTPEFTIAAAFQDDCVSLSASERGILRAVAPDLALAEAELITKAGLAANPDIRLHLALLPRWAT